jgi:hypothetical protein
MALKSITLRMSLAIAAMATGLMFDGDFDRLFSTGSAVSRAEAVIGRPLTPLSYAGVARRTTRRAIRRGAYFSVLPHGCHYGPYYGYNLYRCGGVYYQRSGGGYYIVYF